MNDVTIRCTYSCELFKVKIEFLLTDNLTMCENVNSTYETHIRIRICRRTKVFFVFEFCRTVAAMSNGSFMQLK